MARILAEASAAPADLLSVCFGTYATVVNDGAPFPTGLDAGVGNSGWHQYWYRDPNGGAGSLGSALSDAIQLDFE